MNPKKFFALTLLSIVALLAVVSCEEDENWQPTWAVPIVKTTSLTVGEFVDETMAQEFSAQVKGFWNDYVEKTLEPVSGADSIAELQNIDSLAFAVLTDTTLNFVERDENGNPQPHLRPEVITDNNLTPPQVQQIEEFLNLYLLLNPQISAQSASAKSLRSRAEVRPKAEEDTETAGTGVGAIDNLLDGIAKDPANIFPTVATLMTIMPSYEEQINDELDKVLDSAKMNHLFDLNIKDMVDNAESVRLLEINIDSLKNTLPFGVSCRVNFVDAAGDSIYNLLDLSLNINGLRSDLFTIDNTNSALQKIIDETASISIVVDFSKSGDLNADKIRSLAKDGITFSMRVRVQANMSKLLDF